MRSRHRLSSSPRPAFTLVEMVVVIAIVLALAALAAFLAPRLQDSQRVAKGADTVQGALFLAKQMALRDQQLRGIRLVPDANNPNLFTSLQLIEQPAPLYLPGSDLISATFIPNPNNNGAINPIIGNFAYTNTNPWTPVDFYGGYGPGNPTLWPVQPGDYLDLLGNNKPDGLYLITQVNPNATNPNISDNLTLLSVLPQVNMAPTPNPVPQPPYTLAYQIPATGLPYRIVRGPRVMAGQQPINLPTDVAVDLNPNPNNNNISFSQITPDGTPNFTNFDIMFAPSGTVVRAAGSTGKVILWVRDPTGTDTGEETLVTVYTRTGVITAQPVNVNGPDPYLFVKDGRSSGM